MTKPVSIPNTFATGNGGSVPVSQLDANFSALSGAVNDLATYTNYITDTGSANAYVVNYPVGITVSLVNGLPITFRAANTNTASSTLNANGTGIAPILRPDGSPTQPGDIPSGRIVSVNYDSNASAYYLNSIPVLPATSSVLTGVVNGLQASAGIVGEVLIGTSNGTPLVSLINSNVVSVFLTPGDWDLQGVAQFVPAGTTTIQAIFLGLSTSSTVLGLFSTITEINAAFNTGSNQIISTPVTQVNVSVGTPVYCVVNVAFGVSTMTVNGFIRARRMR